MTTLFSWHTPAFTSGAPVDHTWVTTYDSTVNSHPNIGAVVAAGEDYWFSWGSFHRVGSPTPTLASGRADLALARCLCAPNLSSVSHLSARGTIFVYGVDGVCHQLSNQVLWATSPFRKTPLTVSGAHGYLASVFVYGVYGRPNSAWAARVRACTAVTKSTPKAAPTMTPSAMDAFSFAHVAEALVGTPAAKKRKLEALKAIQDDLRALLDHYRVAGFKDLDVDSSASYLNATINSYFAKAARVLSKEEYERVFGFPPGTAIDLVDREVMASMEKKR